MNYYSASDNRRRIITNQINISYWYQLYQKFPLKVTIIFGLFMYNSPQNYPVKVIITRTVTVCVITANKHLFNSIQFNNIFGSCSNFKAR